MLKYAPNDFVSIKVNDMAPTTAQRSLSLAIKVRGNIKAKYPANILGVTKGKKTLLRHIYSRTKGFVILVLFI